MATYDPSVYDDAYTVLKKILHVEKWLKDHPQLAIGKTSVEVWNDDELGEIAKNSVSSGVALSIGDVILVDHYILDGELDGTKLFQITAEDATKWYGSLIGELQRGPQGLRGPQGIQGPQGPAGADGADGTDGVGVPTGGTTGQVLKKRSSTDYDTEWAADAGGMANPMTSAGDMIFAGAGGLPLALGKGTAGQVLKMDSYGAGPEWATDTQGAAGDALAASAAGADEGQILTADGGGGTTWATPPSPGMSNPMSAAGDLIVGASYGVPSRLAKGTAGQVLKMNSGATAPEWGTDAGAAGDAFAAAMTNTPATINAAVDKVQNIDSTAGMIDAAASTIDEAATANVGDVLTVDSNGEASWQPPSSGGMSNPMTAAGDLIVGGSSGTPARLGKGTAGQVLTMNAGATAPEWQTPSGGGGASIGGGYDFTISWDGMGSGSASLLTLGDYDGVFGWHIVEFDTSWSGDVFKIDGAFVAGNSFNMQKCVIMVCKSMTGDVSTQTGLYMYDGALASGSLTPNKLLYCVDDVYMSCWD